MRSIQGIVTIVQEGRFQVVDRYGVAHHFLLSHKASPEPEQLPELQRRQALVRVWFNRAPDIIGHVAARIDVLEDEERILQQSQTPTAGPARARVHEHA